MTFGNDGGWSQPGLPPGYYAQPKPPTKSHLPWIVGGIIAAVVLVVAVGAAVIFVVTEKDQPEAVEVIYEVTGTGSAEITYHGPDGGFTGPSTETLPWRKQVTMGGEHTFVEVSVERARSSDEPLKCRITADGKVIKEEESVGIFVFCDGRVGET